MFSWFEELGFLVRTAIIAFIAAALIAAGVLGWNAIFRQPLQNQQNNQYKHSQFHEDAVVSDFADLCNQLATAGDDSTKRRAIEVVIAQRAATEDLAHLQMADSIRTCVNNAINDYVNGAHS